MMDASQTTGTTLELTPDFHSKPIRLTVTAQQPVILKHELNRVPAGWLVVDANTAVGVWRSGDMTINQLELTADKDADITLVLL